MKTFFLSLAFFSSCCSFAQTTVLQGLKEKMNNEEKSTNEDYQNDLISEPDSTIIDPEAWDTNFDNLLNSWYVKQYADKLNQEGYNDSVSATDAVYMERLSKLPNIIELPYNETVRRCINLYVERRRNLVEYMLGLEAFYFPMIEETLGKYGLPLELKYLVIIESAMNPVALSRAGAAGLWQFMLPTGKSYGLEINSLIDERCDPIKATDAACRHLKDLYDTYGDWNLAIAAYNCGGGNVNKAIRRAGGIKDYWAIYPYLPGETRSYVPFFIAANYVMNYYASHQLYPVQTSLPLSTDTVTVNRMIHFDQIADVLKIDKELLRALNPQYKRDIIPGNYKPQTLKLPSIQAYAFIEKENEIASYRASELFTNRTYVEESPSVYRSDRSDRSDRIIHRVARGETVVTLAHRYGVTIRNILTWNNLKHNKLRVGSNLILYVDNGGKTSQGSRSYSRSKPTSSVPIASETKKNNSSSKNSYSSIDTGRYRVQPGDSFYTIAQKYPGYSSIDLMKLNNLTRPVLRAGQYIIVPKV